MMKSTEALSRPRGMGHPCSKRDESAIRCIARVGLQDPGQVPLVQANNMVSDQSLAKPFRQGDPAAMGLSRCPLPVIGV